MSDVLVLERDSFLVITPPNQPEFIARTEGLGPEAIAAAVAAAAAAYASAIVAEDAAELAVEASQLLPPAWTGSTPILITQTVQKYSPRNWGALGNGVADDTVAMQKAVTWTASQGLPLYIDSGTYLLKPSTDSWNYRGNPARPTQCAVVLNMNNVHLVGSGGRIVMGPPAVLKPGVGHAYYFATPLNLTAGTYRNFIFEGEIFDADNAFSTGLPNIYPLLAISVRGIKVSHGVIRNSSGTRRGHGFSLYNCSELSYIDNELNTAQQFMNANYCTDMEISQIRATNFTECIDLDSYCQRVGIIGGSFNNSPSSGQSQCLDIVGTDIYVSGIQANDIARNVFGIYTKLTWPTFAEMIANQDAPSTVAPRTERVIVDGVTGRNVGFDNYPSWFVGVERPATAIDVSSIIRSITVKNVSLDTCAGATVREGADINLDRITMRDVRWFSTTGDAGLYVHQATSDPARDYSYLDITATNILIEDSLRNGFVADGIRTGTLSNIRAKNWGLSGAGYEGLRVSSVTRKAGNLNIQGLSTDDLGSGYRSIRFTDDSALATDSTITDLGGHSFKGTGGPMWGGSLGASTGWGLKRIFQLGRLNTLNPSGDGTIKAGIRVLTIPLVSKDGLVSYRMVWAELVFRQAVTFPTNGSVRITLAQVSGGVTTTLGAWDLGTNIAAGTIIAPTTGFSQSRPENTLGIIGDNLILTDSRDATDGFGIGVDMRDVSLHMSLISWTTN